MLSYFRGEGYVGLVPKYSLFSFVLLGDRCLNNVFIIISIYNEHILGYFKIIDKAYFR